MRDMITAADKKQFIQWFLEHYELKNPEAEWLLQYLASSEQLLAKVHFTDHFRHLPKALLMSTTCVQMTAFKFYKNKRVTSDVEKAFLDVHSHPEEDIFVTLYFQDRNTCQEYTAVLEGESAEAFHPTPTELLTSLEAEMWLDHVEREFRLKAVRTGIDEALDRGDRETFLQLARQLANLLRVD